MFKLVSKMSETEQYSVQIAVKLRPRTKVTFFGSNNIDTVFLAGQHEVTIRHNDSLILFCSSGFSTVADANNFVQKLSACACLFSLKNNTGLRINYPPREIRKLPEFLKHLNNDPLNGDNLQIDGTINAFSTFIIPDHKKIVSDDSVLVSSIPEFIPERVFEMYSLIDSELDTSKAFKNTKTELAFYIFSINYIGNHAYSRFLALIICLEILSTEQKVSTFSYTKIDELKKHLKGYLKEGIPASDKNDIKRLIERVGNLKKESITKSVCCLLYKHYDTTDPEHGQFDITNAIDCKKITAKLYNLRSNLVHYGKPKESSTQDFLDHLKMLEGITQDILYAEFKNQYFIKEDIAQK